MKKIALVTGATSGIGLETTRLLLKDGWHVIGTGRRHQKLMELQNEYGNAVFALSFDVRNRDELRNLISDLPEEWCSVSLLINNAGNAHGLEHFQEGKWEDWEAMIDINVKGLLAVTEAVLPLMLKAGRGHIINIGSIAGEQPYARGSVYCASKSAVSMISDCLRIDLNAEGIKVSEIRPGMVETDFSLVRFKGDEARAAQVYQGLKPLSGKDVAEAIMWMVNAPEHVNLSEVVIMPLAQASARDFHRSA
jgi:NADP-dependent 3-hydroxy acid dehydrogenase YdfG